MYRLFIRPFQDEEMLNLTDAMRMTKVTPMQATKPSGPPKPPLYNNT
jgi:hypothetical protein